MFECSICGLLSLNAVSCPACGSQNLIDLSRSDVQADDLPAEIPGLDEAAESWHELEGSGGDFNDFSPKSTNSATANGSLPFGYSGESNIQASRLPFGIGSHADGIPFENQPLNAYSSTPDQIDKWLISLKRSKTLLGSKERKSASEDEKIAISDTEENANILNSNPNLIDQINDLNKLKEQGIISDEEFKKAKEKILN